MEKRYSRYNINIQYTSCNRLIGFPVFKQTSETRDIIRTMGGKHGGWGVKKQNLFLIQSGFTFQWYSVVYTLSHVTLTDTQSSTFLNFTLF